MKLLLKGQLEKTLKNFGTRKCLTLDPLEFPTSALLSGLFSLFHT